MKILSIHRWLVIVTTLVLLSTAFNSFCQVFQSDPGIPNPTITFLNDTVVRLDYDSIYQVHEWWDTVQYPQASGNIRSTSVGKYDYARIFSDLMTVLDASQYHFIPIYGDDDLRYGEIPGWVHAGSRNKFPAKNIGFFNNSYDDYLGGVHPERGNNYSMPHMNDIKYLDEPFENSLGSMPNWGSTLRLFHEIGHTWGVFWSTLASTPLGWVGSGSNWQPWMPTVALVAGGSHWAQHSAGQSSSNNRWVDPKNTGLLTTAPTINRFNIFDLYAMGALSYDSIVDSVLYVRDPETDIEYPLSVDSLVATLSKAQNYMDNTPPEDVPDYLDGYDFMEGDGKRIPATDPNTQHFKTLIVVVTGAESIFSKSDKNLVLKLAKEVPPDWEIATRGYSYMSTKLEHKMVNDFDRRFLLGNSVSIQFEHFVAAYGPYKQAIPDGIRIESLPTKGTLSFNGLAVAAGQVFTPADFAFRQFTYTKNAREWEGDEFRWNAITQGRWAIAAKVNIKPFLNSTPISPLISESSVIFEGIQSSATITAYPNPFDEMITVNSQEDIDTEVEIVVTDDKGKSVYSETLPSMRAGEKVLIEDLPKNASNMLYLSITVSGRTQTKRIVRK